MVAKYKPKTERPNEPVAGAGHGILTKCSQIEEASTTLQDWLDLPCYNGVAQFNWRFIGRDLILWWLKMRVEPSIRERLIFMRAIIAHRATEITSRVMNSIDPCSHNSTFVVKAKANSIQKGQKPRKMLNLTVGTYQAIELISLSPP